MAADPIEPGRAGWLDGEGAERGRVVVLSDRRPPVASGRRAAGCQENASAAILRFGLHFTVADRDALAAWARDTGHGYDRVRIERSALEDGDWASYALVYVPGQAWSTWGVTRRDGHVEVWRCATGQTVGRHVQMADALASLPHATKNRQVPLTDENPFRMGHVERQGRRRPKRGGATANP